MVSMALVWLAGSMISINPSPDRAASGVPPWLGRWMPKNATLARGALGIPDWLRSVSTHRPRSLLKPLATVMRCSSVCSALRTRMVTGSAMQHRLGHEAVVFLQGFHRLAVQADAVRPCQHVT